MLVWFVRDEVVLLEFVFEVVVILLIFLYFEQRDQIINEWIDVICKKLLSCNFGIGDGYMYVLVLVEFLLIGQDCIGSVFVECWVDDDDVDICVVIFQSLIRSCLL